MQTAEPENEALLAQPREHYRPAGNPLVWSLLGSIVILTIIIGFFPRGGNHGLYMDDYTEKAWAFDFSTAKWKLNLVPQFHIRPLAHILIANIGNAIPEHEFPVRVGIVLIHGLNVFLLSWLAYRLSGSFFAATVTGALFLFPIFGNEALLWFTTAVSNTISVALLLIGLHCALSCRSPKEDRFLFCCGVTAWIVMALFYESALFTLLLLPAFLSTARGNGVRQSARLWVPALFASYVPVGLYLVLIERNNPDVLSRGGTTLNLGFIISRRVPEVSKNLWWLISDQGRLPGARFALISGPLREALRFGWREWLTLRFGLLLTLILLLGICLAAFIFPTELGEDVSDSRLLHTALEGLAWVLLCFVPILLVKSQIVEIRTLYAPSAGFAISAASFLRLALHYVPRWKLLSMRFAVLASGIVMFLTSLTMAGVVRTYQLRSSLDQKQIAALQQIISKIPVDQPLWLLPIGLDERSFGMDSSSNAALEAYVYGVFEIPWSARDAIRLSNGKEDVEAVTGNRWINPKVTSVRYAGGRPSDLVVQGRTAPIQQLLAFTYQGGRAIPLSPLDVDSPDGSLIAAIDLPLVDQLATQGVDVRSYHFQLQKGN